MLQRWGCCVGCAHTRRDKIKNECIREKVGVAPILEKIRRW